MRMNKLVFLGGALCALFSQTQTLHAAASVWSGAAGDRAWSNLDNWSGGVPTATTDTVFGSANTTGGAGPAGASNNVVDASLAIQSLAYTNTAGFHHTRIEAGMTLTLASSGTANVLAVGASTTNANQTIYATISGLGTLAIASATNAPLLVSQRHNVGSASGGHMATLDLSGLETFQADVRDINLAGNGAGTPNNTPEGRLYLARHNVITCNGANGILQGSGSQNCGTNLLVLGERNTVNTELWTVGGYKCSGAWARFSSAWPGSSLVLRNRTGDGPMTKWSIAENGTGNTGSACNGTADFTGGTLDVVVNTLRVAASYAFSGGTNLGTSTGTLTYTDGSIVANTVEVGYQSVQNNGRATGTLNVGSAASLLVSNDLRLGRFVGSATAVGGFANGTLNLRGGTVNVMGNVVDGGGTSTILITNNGTLDLQPAGDAAPGDLTADVLTVASGSVQNAGTVTVSNLLLNGALSNLANLAVQNLTLNGAIQNVGAISVSNFVGTGAISSMAGALTVAENGKVTVGANGAASTLAIGGSLVLNNSNVLDFDLASEPAPGGGTNDLIQVDGNLTLSGTITVSLNFMGTPPVTPATYVLIRYSGTLNSTATFVAAGPRYQFTFDTGTPGEVRLVVSGSGMPADLEWYPAYTDQVWDVNGRASWYNLATTLDERFYQADNVLFSDLGDVWPTVTIMGTVKPTAVVVESSVIDYTLAGPGSISGPATLTKRGTPTLVLSNANDYTGATTIESGTIRVGSSTALGATNAGTSIASGAVLDLNGQNLGFETITVRGAGPSGAGAIINSLPGTGFAPGLKRVILADNTTFGGDGRWDIRDSEGGLAGNGFTLTKAGANNMSLKALGETALGDIQINSGLVYFEGNTTMGDPARNLTVNAGGTLGFYSTGTNPLNKLLHLAGGSVSNGAGNNAFFGPVLLDGPSNTFDFASGALTLFGPVTGANSLTKGTASGTLVLAGTNDYPATFVLGGTLGLSNSLALGATHNVVVTTTTGGSGLTGSRVTLWGNVTIPPGVSLSMPSDLTGNLRSTFYSDGPGPNEWQGPVTLNGNNIINFAATTNAPLTLSGPVMGNNFAGVMFMRGTITAGGTIAGTVSMGTSTLGVTDNTFWKVNSVGNVWGITSIAYGSITLGADNALPATATLSLGQNSTADGGTLDLAGFNQQVGALTVAGAPTKQFIGNSSTNRDSTLTFAGTGTSVFGGAIVDAVGGGTRRVGLTVASGSLVLGGDNIYTGPTVISGGTLIVVPTGSVSATLVFDVQEAGRLEASAAPNFTIGPGQTLMGNGVVAGTVTVAPGGTLSPGGANDALTLQGALVLQGNVVMDILKTGPALRSDAVLGLTSVSFDGMLTVVAAGDALAAGDRFRLFDASSYSGAFATTNLPALPAGLQWDTSGLTVDGSIQVVSGGADRPTISVMLGGNALDLSWPSEPAGFVLQSQTNALGQGIGTNWWDFTSPGSNRLFLSPVPTNENVFFRLIKR
ncbi:MAG: autotransporter-associated beta strand repeat-containing protein [Verrucomicrobia bacterium]|nr:autotransporter-associated beta strand repeat-containing protein [Verrucomicrobiota bacterium]